MGFEKETGGFLNVLCTVFFLIQTQYFPLQVPVSVSSVARVPQSPLSRMEARLRLELKSELTEVAVMAEKAEEVERITLRWRRRLELRAGARSGRGGRGGLWTGDARKRFIHVQYRDVAISTPPPGTWEGTNRTLMGLRRFATSAAEPIRNLFFVSI